MKSILVLALLIIAINANSQTRQETEKWLEERLYSFGYYSGDQSYERSSVREVKVNNCMIRIRFSIWPVGGNTPITVDEEFSINSTLVQVSGADQIYDFRGRIKWRRSTDNREVETQRSNFQMRNVPDDMFVRIQNALEHYKRLCGVNEPF